MAALPRGRAPTSMTLSLAKTPSFTALKIASNDMSPFEKMQHLTQAAQDSVSILSPRADIPPAEGGSEKASVPRGAPLTVDRVPQGKRSKTHKRTLMRNDVDFSLNQSLPKGLPPEKKKAHQEAEKEGRKKGRKEKEEGKEKEKEKEEDLDKGGIPNRGLMFHRPRHLITRTLSCPQFGRAWTDFDFIGIAGEAALKTEDKRVKSYILHKADRCTTDSGILGAYVKEKSLPHRRPMRLPEIPRCESNLQKLRENSHLQKLTLTTPYVQIEVLVSESAGKLSIAAGTISDLLGAMFGEQADEEYITSVLFGYRNMMQPIDFLRYLSDLFHASPLPHSKISTHFSDDQLKEWHLRIRRRVAFILEFWIKNHFYDFKASFDNQLTDIEANLRKELDKFIEAIRKDVAQGVGDIGFNLQELLQETDLIRRMHRGNVTMNSRTDFVSQLMPKMVHSNLLTLRKLQSKKKKCVSGAELCAWVVSELQCDLNLAKGVCSLLMQKVLIRIPQKDRLFIPSEKDFYTFGKEVQEELKFIEEIEKPLCQFETEPLSFLEIHPIEFARQLTLLEFEVFRCITPFELYNQVWSSPKTKHLCPNVIHLIQYFNSITFWVATELVNADNQKDRMVVLKRFVIIADALRMMRSYNAMMEIIVGLNLGPVSRLTALWNHLPWKYQEIFNSLMEFTNQTSNYRSYRNHLKSVGPPCLPYVGLYLKDLTFIADGNPKYLDEKNEVINFERIRMEANIFLSLQQFQEHPFPFTQSPMIESFLKKSLFNFSSESELWSRSDALKGEGAGRRSTLRRITSVKIRPISQMLESSLF